MPVAPGTWGSLAALPAAWVIFGTAGRAGLAAAAVIAFAVGIWASGVCIRKYQTEDPAPVVIDEIAGQWLVLLAVAPDVIHYALGFALFRAADILKPWPASWADREVKGGLGVMLDDLLAGLYVAAILIITTWLFSG